MADGRGGEMTTGSFYLEVGEMKCSQSEGEGDICQVLLGFRIDLTL